MKLAEALALRADLQKRISQMDSRLKGCCKVQEGDTPPEDPKELFLELNNLFAQFEDIIFRINKTNMNSILADGESLTRKIARRDVLKMNVRALQSVLEYVTQSADRYSRNEIKYERTIDVAQLRKQTDELSRKLRDSDTEIQAANWVLDLCD